MLGGTDKQTNKQTKHVVFARFEVLKAVFLRIRYFGT
jgi:hypothetical protein